MRRKTPPPPAAQGRLWAYIRASTDKQMASPETQKALLCERAQAMGRIIDGFYVDKAVSGKKPVMEREAASRLFVDMKPGDTILVARLDRFSRSFIDFAKILQSIERRGCYLHILDIPGGVFDPSNPMSEMMIGILICFAQYERRLISIRTKEGLAEVRKRGERSNRHPRWGMKFESRRDPRTGQVVEYEVEDEEERAFIMHLLELRTQGYSIRQIRDHAANTLKYRKTKRASGRKAPTKGKGDLTIRDIEKMLDVGIDLLQQQSRGEGRAKLLHRESEVLA